MRSRIQDLYTEEKPREKLSSYNESILTNVELIALLLGSGGIGESALQLARRILKKYSGIKGLRQCELSELIQEKNIGLAKACTIKAAIELGIRAGSTYKQFPRDKIVQPGEAFSLLKRYFTGKSIEHLYMITLDSRSKVIKVDLLTTGTVNETLIHSREIFRTAIRRNASSVIIAHNHPSGEIEPSSEDIKMTHRVYEAGRQIGIALVDHLIIYEDSFYSMKANNQISTTQNVRIST